MKSISLLWHEFRQDHLLQRVLKNSSYLFSSNSISIFLSMLQSILAARLLGVANLGILGTITVFASTINRLFSFRMSELIVKYLGGSPLEEKQDFAAALVKAAALTEAISALLAFIVLALLAPLGALYLTKDRSLTPLFCLFGISILGNLMTETSTGILQITDRFNAQAMVNLGQSVLTAILILLAFLVKGDLLMVLLAYLSGKMVLGIVPLVLAWRSLNQHIQPGWWRKPIIGLPPWRELMRFAASTNLSATINLIVRDSELLWVAFFLSPLEVGYYKVALAISTLVPIPVAPFIQTTFPVITRSATGRNWAELRHLLRRFILVSSVLTLLVAAVLVIFGKWIILLYGAEYLPSYPALLVLIIGYGIGNLVFWNRPLLLALNKPTYPMYTTLFSGLGKVALALLVIPAFGYVGAAALLSAYFIISGSLMALRGLQEIRRNEMVAPEGAI